MQLRDTRLLLVILGIPNSNLQRCEHTCCVCVQQLLFCCIMLNHCAICMQAAEAGG